VVLYGTEGCGKSTFAAGADNPIFIPTEDGLGSLDVARFPLVQAVADVRDALDTLLEGEHDFKTVVLDSADHLELIIAAEVEKAHDVKDLAYGRGAIKQAEIWRDLLEQFNALRNQRGMAVIILAHVAIKRFDSPETEPYDRQVLKLSERSGSYLREWCDALLFANYRTVVKKAEVGFSKEVARGITNGERLLFTSERPAFMAKNRYRLPDTLPLSWDALSSAIVGSIPTTTQGA
jgi:hypothetical protein